MAIVDVVDACCGMCELAAAAREDIIVAGGKRSGLLEKLDEKLSLIQHTGLEVLRLEANTQP